MKHQGLKTLLLIIVTVSFISSCSPFRPPVRTSPAGEIPRAFSLYASGPERPERWWQEFNDGELSALITEALSGSFTLKEAWARLNQAKALAVQSGAALYPGLSATAGPSYKRQRSKSTSGSRTTIATETYSLGLTSGYALDLWGRIRSEQEAKILDATATREDLNAAAMTLAAELAEDWINIISQRMQKQVLNKQLDINKTYLELIELRYHKSMVSALDVYQQRQVVEQVKAQVPLVEEQEQLLAHKLALLLGKPPRTALAISRSTLPEPFEIPKTGLPADLLASRPDVRAAGLKLRSADWQVAAARANRLPNISLTASAAYQAPEIDLLFHTWLINLAANLTAPLFDGGQRAVEVDRLRAVADENLSAYQRTVYTAIKEVEDALVSEEKKRQHIKALKAEIEAASRALDEARQRYLKGIDNYLPVLTQILKVQGLEVDLIKRQAELLIARVGLYRSLGGTWTDKLTPGGGMKTIESPKTSSNDKG
ncbi:MAG: efflux transporter outer membrane subunit [Deltaproteobacteria bacterium]|nr:efflux transporter outer membrane subunit [Deltaproteobacteria bacterium]